VGRRRDESPRALERGDPRDRFPHRANARILSYLAQGAALSSAPSSHNVDEYVLRTHPDLAEALTSLARPLGVAPRAAYGYFVLATRGGVLFAAALGTETLGLRVPARTWPLALEYGGVPWPEAGDDWVRFDAWDADVPARQHAGDLRYFIEAAFHDAVAVEQAS
jgi:hypothetical protein